MKLGLWLTYRGQQPNLRIGEIEVTCRPTLDVALDPLTQQIVDDLDRHLARAMLDGFNSPHNSLYLRPEETP